jgi:hypothetical protein
MIATKGSGLDVRRRFWRFLGAVAVVVGAAVLFYVSSNRPTPIVAYRLVDQRTVVVTAAAAEATWTRLTSVVESDDAVRVYVESLEWPGNRTAQANLIEFTIVLSRDLGQREIRDGTGTIVPHVEPTGA